MNILCGVHGTETHMKLSFGYNLVQNMAVMVELRPLRNILKHLSNKYTAGYCRRKYGFLDYVPHL
jgi:hypothetical protein